MSCAHELNFVLSMKSIGHDHDQTRHDRQQILLNLLVEDHWTQLDHLKEKMINSNRIRYDSTAVKNGQTIYK